MGSFKSLKKQTGGQPGKIDSPLEKKLQAVKWGEYKLGDLFEVLSYKKRFDANKVTLVENGETFNYEKFEDADDDSLPSAFDHRHGGVAPGAHGGALS